MPDFLALEMIISAVTFSVTFVMVFAGATYYVKAKNGRVNISSKIVASFFIVSIIPILVTSYISFQRAEKIIIDEKLNSLEAIAILKETQIVNFFDSLKQDTDVAREYYNVKVNLPLLINNLNNERAYEALDAQMQFEKSTKNLLAINLLGLDKSIVYSTDDNQTKESLEEIVSEGAEAGVVLSDIYESDSSISGFEISAYANIYDSENQHIGYIVITIDIEPVYALIQDTSGLGDTGETLLAKKEDDRQLVFLNPLRHISTQGFESIILFGSANSISMQRAVLGETGSEISVDYRGKQIITAWEHIPDLDWGLVAKIDTSEAFTPIRELQVLITEISAVLIILILVLAIVISNSITRPISELAKITESATEDTYEDLLVGIRKLKSKDEIGSFVKLYAHMVQGIIHSRKALRDKVIELEKFRELSVGRELKMIELKESLAKLANITDKKIKQKKK